MTECENDPITRLFSAPFNIFGRRRGRRRPGLGGDRSFCSPVRSIGKVRPQHRRHRTRRQATVAFTWAHNRPPTIRLARSHALPGRGKLIGNTSSADDAPGTLVLDVLRVVVAFALRRRQHYVAGNGHEILHGRGTIIVPMRQTDHCPRRIAFDGQIADSIDQNSTRGPWHDRYTQTRCHQWDDRHELRGLLAERRIEPGSLARRHNGIIAAGVGLTATPRTAVGP
jgi:hypothetical protein